ncbi:Gamma-secretase-activating protein [Merluccius polli]|uniref:Gamma-secretase-activating protein n=1 Tax=Merluccius polli TaxID=89951 RepID=A0AA47NN49_MERPO|nr:Gamma-secretase-activating protein [Merluccius polli]
MEKKQNKGLKKRPLGQRVYHAWDHPVMSASISRDYVRTVLEKLQKHKGFEFTGKENMGFKPEFLPLTYLTQTLSEVEQQALNPFAEQESVDARFVEETALKQTFIHLGSLMKDGRTGGGRGDGRSEGGEEELRGGMEGGEGRCGTTMWRSDLYNINKGMERRGGQEKEGVDDEWEVHGGEKGLVGSMEGWMEA